jgi:hypothetical protein
MASRTDRAINHLGIPQGASCQVPLVDSLTGMWASFTIQRLVYQAMPGVPSYARLDHARFSRLIRVLPALSGHGWQS